MSDKNYITGENDDIVMTVLNDDEEEADQYTILLVPHNGGAVELNGRKNGHGQHEEGEVEITTTPLKRGSASEKGNQKRKTGIWQSCLGWTARERLMILAIAFSEGTGFASLSVIAPLFPPLANQRGISRTTSGLVFSSFAIVAFITAPIFGFVTAKFGVRLPMIAGLIISGLSSIAFGLIEDIKDYTWFTLGSFTFRILLGISYSAYITSVFATVTTLFQSQMGLVLSACEIVIGLGLAAGPALGSALFSVGGYKLPFTVIGLTQLVITLPLFWLLPTRKEYLKAAMQQVDSPQDSKTEKKPLWHLFLCWEPVLILTTITVLAAAFVYFHPILQPLLEERFGTTENEAGYVFLAILGSYTLSTPLSGALSDAKPEYMYYQMILGLALAFIGSQIIGPSIFLQGILPTSMETTIAGLMVAGVGFSFAVIPTFHGFLQATINAGYPANVEIFGITSAFWNAAWSLGEAIGPALASGVADALGDYVLSIMAISAILFTLTIVMTVHVVWSKMASLRLERKFRKADAISQFSPSPKINPKQEINPDDLEGSKDPSSSVTKVDVSDAESPVTSPAPKMPLLTRSSTVLHELTISLDDEDLPSSETSTPMYSAVSSPSHIKDDVSVDSQDIEQEVAKRC